MKIRILKSDFISELYEEYKNVYDKIEKAPDSRRNEEIVSAVYEKIEKYGIWIPYYEVEKYYCSKKNKYRKRYENARAITELKLILIYRVEVIDI